LWLVLAGLGCPGLVWAARVQADAGVLRRWYDSSQRVVDGRPILASLAHGMDTLCCASLCAGVFILVALLPCYLALSHYSGTLTHQYAWAVSAAFLSGAAPVAVELPLWLLLTVLVLVVLHRASLLADDVTRGYRSWSQASTSVSTYTLTNSRRYALYATFLLIDVVVVVGANMAYVYIAIYQSSALLVLAQVLMSFFKLLWNSVCMDVILRALARRFAPQLLLGQGYAKAYRMRLMSLQVVTALLNSVVLPCVVVAAVSPNCFFNVFQPAPTVRSAFRYEGCLGFNPSGECAEYAYIRSVTSYDAPFTYSYQCSSSLITYYAPAFVNLCIITVFVVPAAQLVGLQLLQRLPSGCCSGYAHALLRQIVPPILRPLPSEEQNVLQTVTYLPASRVLVSLTTSAGSAGFLRGTAWMLVTLSFLFYTLFLFDTLGDAVGFQDALWVLIVVPLLPALLYAVVAFAERGSSSRAAEGEAMPKDAEVGGETGDVELSVVGTVSPVHSAAGNM
jgi:hypothetical protein